MAIEQFFTLQEVADRLHISQERARLLVKDEPGVVKLEAAAPTIRKRRRLMYRIPSSVLERILRRSANPERAA